LEDTDGYRGDQARLGKRVPDREAVPIEVKKRKYTPVQTMRYCPLIPRLKLLLAHPVFSHVFDYGDEHMYNLDPDTMDDIHQSPIFRRFADCFPKRSEVGDAGICDVRVGLGLSADRASVSKQKMRNDFAVLPVLLQIVNFPIWLRNQEKYLLLSCLPPLVATKPGIFFGNITAYRVYACFA
jgi:hypothetical protein